MTAPSPTAPPAAPPRAKRRGFEGALDMVRSLGLVLLVVVPMWFLAQPNDEDEQEIRVVDQSADVAAWSAQHPGAPLPTAPDGWRATVSDLDGGVLRLGWNTDAGEYAEHVAAAPADASLVEELTGSRQAEGTVDVGGASWERYRDEDGSLSLVRQVGDVTLVVGTRRASASDAEVTELAASLRAR